MEKCKRGRRKVVAVDDCLSFLDIDSVFGAETTALERWSFTGIRRLSDDVFCQVVAFGFAGDNISCRRGWLFGAEASPSPLSMGEVANWKLVVISEGKTRRAEILSGQASVARASSRWMGWSRLFPKSPKTPFSAISTQRLHFRRHRGGNRVHRDFCCLGVFRRACIFGALGCISISRPIRLGDRGWGGNLDLGSSGNAHCCQYQPLTANRSPLAVFQRRWFRALCHALGHGSFTQCCNRTRSQTKRKRWSERWFG